MSEVSIGNTQASTEPSLEEQAIAAGIDPAKLDNTSAEQTADSRPDWLPAKFKTPEDLAKSYAEMEKKLSQKGSAPSDPEDDPEVAPEDNPGEAEAEPTTEESAREVVEGAGLDFDAMSSRFAETGKVDEKDYKALEKAGIPRHLVDQFAAGQQAVTNELRNSVFTEVGGENQYNTMTGWAFDNFSSEEIEAYNSAVDGPNRAAALMAVKGLKARYEAEAGAEPSRKVTGSKASSSGSTYGSVHEMMADMNDPRYKKGDAAFVKKVEQKLARSDIPDFG